MANLLNSSGPVYLYGAIALAVLVLVVLLLVQRARPRHEEDEDPDPLTRWAPSTMMPDDAELPPRTLPDGTPQFLSQTDLGRVDRRAEQVLVSLRKKMPGFDFDEPSVKFLSDRLNDHRMHLPPDEWDKFAPYYGAYLGKAILACHRYLEGRWARDGDEWVLVFKVRGQWRTLAPAMQVLQHLEHGEEFSLHRCFSSVHALFKQ